MKNLFKIFIAIFSIFVVSCTEEAINRDAVATSTAPVLKTPSSVNYVLNKNTPNDLITSLVWDYAAYSGTSTPVTYEIQLAKTGTNFANPQIISTSTSKFKDVTVTELNKAMNKALLVDPEDLTKVFPAEIRIKAYLGTTGSLPQYSNTLAITAKSYPDYDNWGIIGSAVDPYDWSKDLNLKYDAASDSYSILVDMKNEKFKFRKDDSWDLNYGGSGGALVKGGADISVTDGAGKYLVKVDFNKLTYSLTKQ